MQSSVKVSDRLSVDREDNSNINNICYPKQEYGSGIEQELSLLSKETLVNDMACRLCAQGSDETQEHLQFCGGTSFERKGS